MDTLSACALAASAAAPCARTDISSETILGWALTVGSLNFGVLGFIYGIYANLASQGLTHLGIMPFLRAFSAILALVISVLTLTAMYLAYTISAPFTVAIIISCLAIVSIFSIVLVAKMQTPREPEI